jgi:hypothetical protein
LVVDLVINIMSIFGNHIAESDEILRKWYIIPEETDVYVRDWDWDSGRSIGWMYPDRMLAPEDIQSDGSYCTAIAAYDDWRPSRPYRMAEQYHIDRLSEIRIDKKHYFRQLQKAYEKGEIKAHIYNGQRYYRWKDVCSFHTFYEIELIVKYCKKHRYHWDGPLEP